MDGSILFPALSIFMLAASLVYSEPNPNIEQFYITTYKDFRRQQSLEKLPWFKNCLKTGSLTDQQACIDKEVNTMQPGNQKQMLSQLGKAPLELSPGQYNEALKSRLKKLFYDSLLDSSGQPSSDLQKNILINQEDFQIALERVLTRQLFFDLAKFCQQELNSDLSIKAAQQCLEKIKQPCRPLASTKAGTETSSCLIRKKLVQLQKVLLAIKEQQPYWLELKQKAKDTPILTLSQQLLGKELPTHLFNQMTSQELVENKKSKSPPGSGQAANQGYSEQLEQRMGQEILLKQTLIDLQIKSLSPEAKLSSEEVKKLAQTTGLYSEEEIKELSKKSPEDIKKDLELRLQGEKQAIIKQINEQIARLKQTPNQEDMLKKQWERQKSEVILANYLQAAIGTIQSSPQNSSLVNVNTNQEKIRSDRTAFDREMKSLEEEMKGNNTENLGFKFTYYQEAFKSLDPQLSPATSGSGRSYASSSAQDLLTLNPKAIEELLGSPNTP